MDNEFRKEKLNNGCIVQLRNGDKCIYLENANIFRASHIRKLEVKQ